MGNLVKPVALFAGAVLVLAGSFMTWISVDVGFATFSTTGTETTDGKLTAAAAAVMILAAGALAARGRVRTIAGVIGFVAAVFASIVLFNDYLDVRERIANTDPDAAAATVGLGVWVTAIGCTIALAALVWSMVDQRRAEA